MIKLFFFFFFLVTCQNMISFFIEIESKFLKYSRIIKKKIMNIKWVDQGGQPSSMDQNSIVIYLNSMVILTTE
jgi:hypothetical protein